MIRVDTATELSADVVAADADSLEVQRFRVIGDALSRRDKPALNLP
jgi:hypothetical protein